MLKNWTSICIMKVNYIWRKALYIFTLDILKVNMLGMTWRRAVEKAIEGGCLWFCWRGANATILGILGDALQAMLLRERMNSMRLNITASNGYDDVRCCWKWMIILWLFFFCHSRKQEMLAISTACHLQTWRILAKWLLLLTWYQLN